MISGDEQFETELTTVVENDSATQQQIVVTGADGSFVQGARLEWRPDAVLIRETVHPDGAETTTCVLDKPIRTLPTTLDIGEHWTSESSCTITQSGQDFLLLLSSTSVVTRAETFKVGGTDVEIWRIERDETLEVRDAATSAFVRSERGVGIDRFAPELGSIVWRQRQVETHDGTKAETTVEALHVLPE